MPADPLDIYARVNSRAPDHEPHRHTRIPVPEGPAPGEPVPSYPLFQVSDWVKRSLTRLENFSRIAYEALIDVHAVSNARYAELFIDPVTPDWPFGYPQIVDAYLDSMAAIWMDDGDRAALSCRVRRGAGCPGAGAVSGVAVGVGTAAVVASGAVGARRWRR